MELGWDFSKSVHILDLDNSFKLPFKKAIPVLLPFSSPLGYDPVLFSSP